MRKISFLSVIGLAIAILAFASCSDAFAPPPYDEQEIGPNLTPIPQSENMIVLGEKLNNPYSLKNMQKVLNTLSATKGVESETLEATDYYIRMRPRDTTEYRALMDLELDLFDYPLDYDILEEGDYYHDPDVPGDEVTWLYAVAPLELFEEKVQYEKLSYDFEPEKITEVSFIKTDLVKAELLEECFIPDHAPIEDTKSGKAFTISAEELEFTAIQMTELPEKYKPNLITKGLFGSSFTPNGDVFVEKYSPSSKIRTDVPVTHARVRAHYFVKICDGYTDTKGHFEIRGKYSVNPHMTLVFKNDNDVIIWGTYAFLAPAQHSMKRYTKSQKYKVNIDHGTRGWDYAVINNAVSDFYSDCETNNILKPPGRLRIWAWPGSYSSSAPMLRHIGGFKFALGGAAAILAALGCPAAGVITGTIAALLDIALPDIFIGIKRQSDSYNARYASTIHELHHASHFRVVGESFWGPYIEHCVWNSIYCGDCYGDGLKCDAKQKICELGEAWAYANERKWVSNLAGNEEWFSPAILSVFDLIEGKHLLTRQQVFSCLTKKTKSIDTFFNNLVSSFPEKAYQIADVFTSNMALTNQSSWAIKNSTSGTPLWIKVTKEGFTETKRISSGEELTFGSTNTLNKEITVFREDTKFYPDELSVSLYKLGRYVEIYHEILMTATARQRE